jgi:hypothetical protein
MADLINPEESDLDRVARMIAELDGEEFLLAGLDPLPPTPEIAVALTALQEKRAQLEEELADVWAKTCNKC